ncbi:hypothetical protein D3C80_1744570 [compost metagenome]
MIGSLRRRRGQQQRVLQVATASDEVDHGSIFGRAGVAEVRMLERSGVQRGL